MPKILSISDTDLNIAAESLKQGKLVAYPTDTLYGLGANAYSDEAVMSVFEAKKRNHIKPISINYFNFEDAEKDFFISKKAKQIAEIFLPGPLTIILEKRPESRLSKYLSPNQNIGIRVSSHPILRKLMKKIPFPITSSSANLSMCITKNATEIAQNLSTINDLVIIDAGRSDRESASTVIDLTTPCLKFIRVGAISEAKFKDKYKKYFNR